MSCVIYVRCIVSHKSMRNIIQFTEDSPKSEPWIRVGSGFSTLKGNGFNLVIGNEVPVERGSSELKETIKELVLRPGDELYLGEATNKDGKVVTTKKGATVYRLQLKPRRDKSVQPEQADDKKDESK